MRQPGGGDAMADMGFWRFSLALYGRRGVAAALLALQDRAGRDINLMLLALWLGACRHRRLDGAELAAAKATIEPLNAVVIPLRTLRRQLTAAADDDLWAVRRRILALELAAERKAQERLARSFPSAIPKPRGEVPLAAAAANLALYLGDDAGSPEARLICAALATLVRAADAAV